MRREQEKTEILVGEKETAAAVIRFFKNATFVCACADSSAPSIAMSVEPIKQCYEDLKKRNIEIKWITEITKDNLDYCKALMRYAEVRHLDGVRGNFGVSDCAYIGTATVNKEQGVQELIYSNAKSIIEQNKYVFDTLWSKSILAPDRIKEIEQGAVRPETNAVKEPMQILHRTIDMVVKSKKYSVCSVADGLLYAHNYSLDAFKKILLENSLGKHDGIRWITNIETGADGKLLQVVKDFTELGMQIRHVQYIPPMSFGVSENELGITIENLRGGNLSTSAIFSSEPAFVQQFETIFEELWALGIDAETRIKEIESESATFIEVIHRPLEIQERYSILPSLAKRQILLFLPTTTAYRREEKIGIFDSLRAAAERGVEIRILIPVREEIDERIQAKLDMLKGLQIRRIKTTAYTEARSKILIIDRKQYLMVELKDDSKETFAEAVGSAIYSNSKSTILSYATMFDSMWGQSELYEKLDAHDRLQREFINIAAHELRTPAQSILGYSELLKDHPQGEDTSQMLEGLTRNAYRLQGLINDILDVARIEAGSLHLEKRELILDDLINTALADAESQARAAGSKVKILYSSSLACEFKINADKERVLQVLANLMSNALKFTSEGKVEIITHRQGQHVLISVKDSGIGIDPEIYPKLFEKFASKSERGTGLGLFISKNIVEAHGGKIWAENNSSVGATFTFALPLHA